MSQDTRIGTELAGYRIEAFLGRGGMSVVYLAEDLDRGRKVALKLLSPELAANEQFRDRFLKESSIARSLDHPNIVSTYDAGEADGEMYIAMRYVDGSDLKTLLKVDGPLDRERVVSVIDQVSGALDSAHVRGLVHRDVKPSNVLVQNDPDADAGLRAYLADFGITKQVLQESVTLTQTGQLVGTMEYVAPEQIKGEQVDARTDVYSLGCMLYECLTGKVPFPRDIEVAAMWAHIQDTPPKISVDRKDLPASLDDVVARAMAKPPDDRYSTAGSLAMDLRLELGMAGAVVPAEFLRERKRAKRLAKWRRIRPKLAWGSGAVALAVAVTFGVITFTRGPGPVIPTVNTAARFDPTSGDFTKAIRVGADPKGVTVGEGSVWVISQTDSTVQRIDPEASDPVVANKSTSGTPTGIAAGEGAAWITTGFGQVGGFGSALNRFELADNSVKQYVSLPSSTGAVAAGLGFVWVVDSDHNRVIRVDPKIQESQNIRVAEAPNNIAIGSGATSGVWVSSGIGHALSRIEIAGHNTSVHKFDVGAQLADVTVDKDWVWAVSTADDSVLRIDPSKGEVTKTIKVADSPGAITEAGGRVWVASRVARKLSEIDPATGRVILQVPVRGSPTDIATDTGGNVWVVLASQ
ncbi:MAG TPA: protein kinase [Actinomycetota bacterium]|nr:protein kinase [Actinomycetota bacterium]